MVFILWDNRQGKSRGNQAWQGSEVARNSCAAEVARACWRKVSHEAGTETRPSCVSIKRVQVLKLVPGTLRVTQSHMPCHLGFVMRTSYGEQKSRANVNLGRCCSSVGINTVKSTCVLQAVKAVQAFPCRVVSGKVAV